MVPNQRLETWLQLNVSSIDYEQKAIIANIKSEKSFLDTTWQRFLSDSIVAILPLSENQASIVWSCKDELADKLEEIDITKLSTNLLSEAVEYRFG